MEQNILEVNSLCKSYQMDHEYVIENINMQVKRGTIHGIIGHNGSGKTTLIKCLTGIFKPEEGEITLNGESVFDNIKVKQKIGYVADSNQMFSSYKVRQLVTLYHHAIEEFSVSDFHLLNKIFNIDTKKRISQLSKGQQMRVSFMLNMARNPDILILDEPTSGLDAMAKKELLDELVSTVENRGVTVVISSHHLNELEKICDSATMITDGKVLMQSDLEHFMGQIVKYQVIFPKGAPSALYQRNDICNLSNVGSVYTVILSQKAEKFEKEMYDSGAVLVEEMKVGLEESFIYMNKYQKGEENSESKKSITIS